MAIDIQKKLRLTISFNIILYRGENVLNIITTSYSQRTLNRQYDKINNLKVCEL